MAPHLESCAVVLLVPTLENPTRKMKELFVVLLLALAFSVDARPAFDSKAKAKLNAERWVVSLRDVRNASPRLRHR